MNIPQSTIEHCNKHKRCVGCKFAGGQCVAPVSDRDFPSWVEKMNKLISEEAE